MNFPENCFTRFIYNFIVGGYLNASHHASVTRALPAAGHRRPCIGVGFGPEQQSLSEQRRKTPEFRQSQPEVGRDIRHRCLNLAKIVHFFSKMVITRLAENETQG